VSGPHPEGLPSSTSSSRQHNFPSKYDNSSVSLPKITLLSAPMPINDLPINRQQSTGTGSFDSHCSPVSGTSQGSADMSDAMDQPPSDYLTRLRLLEQYASAIAELVKEEVNFIFLVRFSFFLSDVISFCYFSWSQPVEWPKAMCIIATKPFELH
jgi:serine/threonine-protein kinase ULK2